jgi:hypothetical protein
MNKKKNGNINLRKINEPKSKKIKLLSKKQIFLPDGRDISENYKNENENLTFKHDLKQIINRLNNLTINDKKMEL